MKKVFVLIIIAVVLIAIGLYYQPKPEVTDPTELSQFKEKCISNGTVTCEWDVLKSYLENHTVTRVWWDLDRDARYSIATKAIKNTPYGRLRVCTGSPNCEGPTSACRTGSCALHAAVRYTKFATPETIIDALGIAPTGNVDGCYFKVGDDGEIQCLRQPDSYGLPCNFVQIFNTKQDLRHIVCAVQIENSVDSLDNWVLFQYSSVDIKPGNTQMPIDSHVVVYYPETLYCFGLDSRTVGSVVIAEFYI